MYEVHKTDAKIKIDGQLNEGAWNNANKAYLFAAGKGQSAPEQPTEFMALWDEKNLYVSMVMSDSNIASKYEKKSEQLWRQDSVQVIFNKDNDLEDYHLIHITPAAVSSALYYKQMWTKGVEWKIKTKIGVSVDGTLNKPDDKDKGWTTEAAIPLKDITTADEPGQSLRFNLGRTNVDNKKKEWSSWAAISSKSLNELYLFGEMKFLEN